MDSAQIQFIILKHLTKYSFYYMYTEYRRAQTFNKSQSSSTLIHLLGDLIELMGNISIAHNLLILLAVLHFCGIPIVGTTGAPEPIAKSARILAHYKHAIARYKEHGHQHQNQTYVQHNGGTERMFHG